MNKKLDLKFMMLAYKQAKKGYGKVAPNPLVGAVLVKDDKVLATGFHAKFGADHAEVDLLKKVSQNESLGAIMYVTLLPCCHTGKTPPCVEAIIKAGISKVVYASEDPNPLVLNKSVKILQDAGIEVVKLDVPKIDYLNRKFFYNIRTGKPYITLKIAMTIDGKVALNSGLSKGSITCHNSRSDLYKIRAGYQSILVGSGTLIADNPNLGVHGMPNAHDPFRFLFTNKEIAGFDTNLQFFRDSNYALVDSVDSLLTICKDRAIGSILVEGGPKVFSYFMKNQLFNELIVYYGDFVLGSDHLDAINELGIDDFDQTKKLKLHGVKRINNNIRATYLVG
jgi:diaminohydroxyphosphoribosylaminopyrimidine deaminase/5-amino-6-(5-phosphoribosylamino)uracil reductase